MESPFTEPAWSGVTELFINKLVAEKTALAISLNTILSAIKSIHNAVGL